MFPIIKKAKKFSGIGLGPVNPSNIWNIYEISLKIPYLYIILQWILLIALSVAGNTISLGFVSLNNNK